MRIIGSGLIASAFRDHPLPDLPPLKIFASGVSNSQSNSSPEFSRERNLLEVELIQDNMRLVYFSTMSLEDPYARRTPYLKHKASLEELVRDSGNLVVRLPLVVGPGGNERTLLNYFSKRMSDGSDVFAIEGAKRSVIDVLDLVTSLHELVLRLPDEAPVQRITGPELTPVSELASQLRDVLRSQSRIILSPGRSEYPIYPENFFSETVSSREASAEGYVRATIKKYFAGKAL